MGKPRRAAPASWPPPDVECEASATASVAPERNIRCVDEQEDSTMAESYTGDAYCVKCKEKRDFTGEVHETNGRRMAKGICPVCGTKLNRILGKA